MKKITPSEALKKMNNFTERVGRLERNQYSDKRFRTQDLNAMRGEWRYLYLWHSIAIFNKNKDRAKEIIGECDKCYMIASNWL